MPHNIQEILPWLTPSWFQLNAYIHQNRIPQALLIIGNKGLGKKQLVYFFAQSLLCTERQSNGKYCGVCQSCTLFKAKTHPDFSEIKPEVEGKTIGISMIRELIVKLTLKPQFESHRVVIINPADSLNNASANAFLKCLEEPTERTCLILIADKPYKLPATILSRCQKIMIPIPDEVLFSAWWEKQGVSNDKQIALNLAQGAPLLAKEFIDSGILKLRTESFKQWIQFTKNEANFVLLAEQWSKAYDEKLELLFFWMTSWIIDLIKLSFFKQETPLYNPDLAINLQEIGGKLDLKEVYGYYDFLLLSQKRLDTSLNKQLIIEEALIRWSNLNGK